MSDTANVSFRIPAKLAERIDKSADRAGQTRIEYIVGWLPDTFDDELAQLPAQSNGAKAPASVA